MADQKIFRPEVNTPSIEQPEKLSSNEHIFSPVVKLEKDTENDNPNVSESVPVVTNPTTVEENPGDKITEMTSPDIKSADTDWISEVREVIQEDKDQPFKEQEDAESLNEAYMEQRFGVRIDEEDK